jgi:hypothetical protein
MIDTAPLRNEFIFLFVDGSIHPKKKWRETASLRVAHDAKFPSLFFRMDTPSTNKTNKFIAYHLIISKHQYYGLIDYLLFYVPQEFFTYMETSPLPVKGCKIKAYARRSGPLSCHTCCDTGPRFFRSHPKGRPI